MSRASGASFAQFFPAAPRAAKDKAKEREKVKIFSHESPSIRAVADTKSALASFRVEDGAQHPSVKSTTQVADTSTASAEDSEYVQGDLLNGVGSASSHSSTVSSVFSTAALQNSSSTSTSRNISSMTPLTNFDSSPNGMASPNQHKTSATGSTANGISSETHTSQDEVVRPHTSAEAAQPPSDPRIYARDPNKVVKGNICTYDPLIDLKIHPNERKRGKPTYKDIGLVRTTHNISAAGSVILLV